MQASTRSRNKPMRPTYRRWQEYQRTQAAEIAKLDIEDASGPGGEGPF